MNFIFTKPNVSICELTVKFNQFFKTAHEAGLMRNGLVEFGDFGLWDLWDFILDYRKCSKTTIVSRAEHVLDSHHMEMVTSLLCFSHLISKCSFIPGVIFFGRFNFSKESGSEANGTIFEANNTLNLVC